VSKIHERCDEIELITQNQMAQNAISMSTLEEQMKKLHEYTKLQIEEKYKQAPQPVP